jgi:diphthine-ammonia ligase
MYQTIGHSSLSLIASALDLPLYTRIISGTSLVLETEYGTAREGDETEDMHALIGDVLRKHPEVEAVSVGAIASNYQRVRVENV